MIKIVIIGAVFACAKAQGLGDFHSHDSHSHQAPSHGHAYSSQSFVLHQPSQHQKQQEEYHHEPQYHHQPQYHYESHSEYQQEYHQPQYHQPQYHHVELRKPEPVQAHKEYKHEEQEYAYPKYDFAYEIKDPHTNDIKSQHESRDGDVVKGSYSFHEADGTIRIVEYTVDKHSGFNAVVKREGYPTEQPKHH